MLKYSFNIKKFFKIENIFFYIILILGAIILIPREPEIVGSDTFEIIWMAKAIVFGEGAKWFIHPLSFFGFYPFSFYPIGLPAIIAFLLLIFKNMSVIAFIVSTAFFIIGSLGAYKFSKLFLENKLHQLLFISCFSFAPLFNRFLYNTLIARTPIIALSIWFYYFLFKFWKTEEKKNILFSILILVLMMFFHRLWIVFLVIYILLGIAWIIKKNKKINDLFCKNKIVKISFVIFNIGLMVAGYYFFGIDSSKINSPWFSNENVFGLIFNVIVDYGFRIGVILIFAPIEIYNLFKGGESNETYFLLKKIMICFLTLTWTYSTYSTIVLLPFILILSIDGIKRINEKYNNRIFLSLIIVTFIITIFYNLLIIKQWYLIVILFMPIIFVFLIRTELAILVRKGRMVVHKLQNEFFLNAIISLVIFSLFTNAGILSAKSQNFPYYYTTDEEKEISDFITDSGIVGVVYVSSPQVASHLTSYKLIKTIPGFYLSATQLYYNWISAEEVKNSTQFDLSYFMKRLSLEYSGIYPETKILNLISETLANTSEGIQILKEMDIQYAVVLKTDDGMIDYNHYITYGYYFSDFLSSLSQIQYAYETQHLIVWKFYY